MNNNLGTIDRATLGLWRVANVTGWSFLALFLALNLHAMIGISDPNHLALTRPGSYSPPVIVLQFWIRSIIAVGFGAGIGALVGKKVWRRQGLCAAIVSAFYLVVVIGVLEKNSIRTGSVTLPDGSSTVLWQRATAAPLVIIWEIIAVSTIPIAVLVARRFADMRRQKPLQGDV